MGGTTSHSTGRGISLLLIENLRCFGVVRRAVQFERCAARFRAEDEAARRSRDLFVCFPV